MKLQYIVQKKDSGKTVEEILLQNFLLSRLLLKKIRLYGTLEVDKKPFRMIDKVFENQCIEAAFQEEQDSFQIHFSAPNEILLWQDDWLLVANKPAKLVTHPCYLHQENSLLHCFSPLQKDELQEKAFARHLHPINRLDRDTSGLVLIGKCSFSQYAITQQNLEKTYLAFCHGLFDEKKGHIHLPIAREENSIILRKIDHEQGQNAHTEYEVIRSYEKAKISLVKIKLHTGRTHQIRLHFLSIGHPLVGEGLYGIERVFHPQLFGETYQMQIASQEKKESLLQCDWKNYQGVYQLPAHNQGDHAHLAEKLDVQTCYHWNFYLDRQALHANKLLFHHPLSKEKMHITAPLPQDLCHLQKALEDFEK